MTELSDKEIVAACARAIGVQPHPKWNAAKWPTPEFLGTHGVFNPLTDRAQAMELVEKLGMSIEYDDEMKTWFASQWSDSHTCIEEDSLLRAICLCAARVQIEKEKNA